eukprot:GFKZ01015500.1.p1 GENE.GFKZ01015500.1~~GFKZ01015500.1.p1  ORF type:complete len:391 (-),score=35.11 GFKZ01015500.1:507-1679(-)
MPTAVPLTCKAISPMAFLPTISPLPSVPHPSKPVTSNKRIPIPHPSPLPRRRARFICSAINEKVREDPRGTSPGTLQRYFETFEWRNYRINYRCEGPAKGLPVLLIHGFGASINHWRKNIPALVETAKFRVYAIDLLGFGGSDKPNPSAVEYSIELWAELVCNFVYSMGFGDKWSLIGNSIGSLIALAAANKLGPQNIRALSLMNSAGGLVSFRYSELNPLQAVLLRLFNTALFNRFTGPYLFDNFRKRSNIASVLKQVYIDQSAISEDLLDILCEPSMDPGACAVFLGILNADAGPSPEELLVQLQWCPMLVLWGEKDPWTPLREGFHPGIKFPDYHPGLQLEIIPNAGHCIHDECPDKVNKILVPFLLAPTLKGDQQSALGESAGDAA